MLLSASERLRNASCLSSYCWTMDPEDTESVLAAARSAARALDPAGIDEATAARIHHEILSGTWAVVEHFEDAGQRFLVLRRNPSAGQDSHFALTPREREIAAFAALGHSSKRIAFEMGIAESTVSGHVSRLVAKLGLRSRLDLVRTLATLAALTTSAEPRH